MSVPLKRDSGKAALNLQRVSGDTIVMWNDQAFTLSEDPGDEEFTTRFGMIDAPEVANLKYGKEGEPGGDRPVSTKP